MGAVPSNAEGGDDAKSAPNASISFARDIRPILQNHCGSCHGADPKTREAGLRLDVREAALERRDGGDPAIVPGKPDVSQLVKRIESRDPSEQMPPASAKKPLTAEQKSLLKRWIADGAPYAPHWAFQPPQKIAPPDVKDPGWAKNPIDRFVLARLEAAGLSPSPEASREMLLRRATLDLTGVSPTLEELDAFLADASPDAYEKAVDRLLNSPRYAERMTAHWLDLARYADSNGYNNDEERTMWPWRDWVIKAFRENLPYDRFLVEQLAGDLLPEPTLDQRIATAFNRNHVLTTEGGIIEDEYRVEYVSDRVHTTASVFLGLSMQCARCHDHKYDPITQREFYQFYAYFNRLPDTGVGYNQGGVAAPFVKAPTAEQSVRLATLRAREDELKAALALRARDVAETSAKWEQQLTETDREAIRRAGPRHHFPLNDVSNNTTPDRTHEAIRGTIHGKVETVAGKRDQALKFDGQTFVDLGDIAAFDSSDRFSFALWIHLATADASTALSRMDDATAFRGYDVILEGGKVAVHLVDHWPDNGLKVITKEAVPLNEWRHVVVSYDGSKKAAGVHLYVDGKAQPLEVLNDKLTGTLKTAKPFHLGKRQSSVPFRGLLDDLQIFAADLSADDAARLAAGQPISRLDGLLKITRAERTREQQSEIDRAYLDQFDTAAKELRAELAKIPSERTALEKLIPSVMVMQDSTPRKTHLLKRGQYDQPGEAVEPGVPAMLPALPVDAAPNRLGLAQWLVTPGHPLTSRIAVNRYWELCFGTGLVETSEDFGVTGSLPTHPELLDWLALEFEGRISAASTPWDIRRLLRTIVTSATYRQSSQVTRELLERDPKNQLLSRSPRLRLSAESVRDNTLALSGLLVERAGGPSVKPYQPEGLWEEVSVERRYKYVPDAGDGLYRRTMYTFWKRTCPPPSLSTFDAPTRETCTIRRARTNTPLQSLVLLNDPTYVEAARKLAERTLGVDAATTDQRITGAFRHVTARLPETEEVQELGRLLHSAQQHYQKHPDDAKALLQVGKSLTDPRFRPEEVAAWTIVSTTLLNLDTTITRE